jgi:hypothetical protein
MIDVAKINLEKLSQALPRYKNQWVAISARNEIVANGRTYKETVDQVEDPEEVVLLKVTPADVSLAPSGA